MTDSVQNYSYNFNTSTGNLIWRQNNLLPGLREDFQYDNLDRLSLVSMNNDTILAMSYDINTGGITGKSDAGTFGYELSEKPYAIKSIDPSTGLTPGNDQSIEYTSFNSVSKISENDYEADFIYDSGSQRSQMVIKQNGNAILTRWYPSGNYIKEIAGVVTKEYTFIGGDAYTAPAVAIKQNDVTKYYSIIRDHLGSITHVVDSTGTVIVEYSYDAWGRMRDPATWVDFTPGTEPQLMVAGRGYTGHEHLPWFNSINMNGRVYDPLIGMFMSPDNYVQSPGNSQNFNRYSYCLNNPLIYIDPSGYLKRKKRSSGGGVCDDGPNYGQEPNTRNYSGHGGGGGESSSYNPSGPPMFEYYYLYQNGIDGYSVGGGPATGGGGASYGDGGPSSGFGLIVEEDQQEVRKLPTYRPDADGRLTFWEAMYWYQNGNGLPLYLNLELIDLSNVHLDDFFWAKGKQIATVSLLSDNKANLEEGLVHGRLILERISSSLNAQVRYNDEVHGRGEMFQFDWQWDAPLKRNIGTKLGGLVYGFQGFTFVGTLGCIPLLKPIIYGKPFPIYYYGTIKINP